MKIIAWGRDRPEALGRAQRALDELVISGVAHTARFSSRILRSYQFRKGDFTTESIRAILEQNHRRERSSDEGRV